MALPLVPALTPGWPRTGGVPVLLLAIPFAAYGIVRARRGSLTPAVLLLSAAFPLYALYTGNGLDLATGDNAATRVLPSLFLTHGTVDLATTPPFDGATLPYAATRVGAHVLNMFPSGTVVVALPHAALALLGSGGRVTPALVSRWDKHAAGGRVRRRRMPSLSRSASVGQRRRARRHGALRARVAGPSVRRAIAVERHRRALHHLPRARTPAARATLPATAGLVMALAFACRPTALIPAFAMAAALAALDRRSLLRYAAALGAGVALVAAVQLALYGHPLGAYGAMNTAARAFNAHVASSLAGVLASPSRGLLVFCPWVLLVPFGLRLARRTDRALFAWSLAGLAASAGVLVLAASHVKWWGGWSLGPRLLTEATPFLALACVPVFREARRPLRAASSRSPPSRRSRSSSSHTRRAPERSTRSSWSGSGRGRSGGYATVRSPSRGAPLHASGTRYPCRRRAAKSFRALSTSPWRGGSSRAAFASAAGAAP